MSKSILTGITKCGANFTLKRTNGELAICIHRLDGGICFEANKAAMTRLSDKAYKLYTYLLMLSPTHIWKFPSKRDNIYLKFAPDEWKTIVQELIDCKYLQPGIICLYGETQSRNSYHLYESPEMAVAAS